MYGFPVVHLGHSRSDLQNFTANLNHVMLEGKLNRSMAQLRHLNPDMYRLINDLWKNKIGISNIFRLKFTLTYLVCYLEDYLVLCEKRF